MAAERPQWPADTPKPSPAQMAWMYEHMVKSRAFEERLIEIYMKDKMPVFDMGAGVLAGELHPSNGQEPVAVGVCATLSADDCVSATHRPHHVAIARGVRLNEMTAEIFGRATGLSGGRGGHMHLYDATVGFSCSGIIGEGLGPAAGMAFAKKQRREPGVAVAFTGEGAANQGAFHEVLNLVGVYRLPFVCVIEDNDYAVTVKKSESTAIQRNSDRAAAYGLVGEYVVGNDPDLIYAAAARAIERARNEGGGTVLEIQTTRLQGHFVPDQQTYRPPEELAGLVDMIPIYRTRLIEEVGFGQADIAAIEQRARQDVEAAIRFALDSPFPDVSVARQGVFA